MQEGESLERAVRRARKVCVRMMEKDQIQMRVLKLVPVTDPTPALIWLLDVRIKSLDTKSSLFSEAEYSHEYFFMYSLRQNSEPITNCQYLGHMEVLSFLLFAAKGSAVVTTVPINPHSPHLSFT